MNNKTIGELVNHDVLNLLLPHKVVSLVLMDTHNCEKLYIFTARCNP